MELMQCGMVYARISGHGIRRMYWTEFGKSFFFKMRYNSKFVLFDRSGRHVDDDSDRMLLDVNTIYFTGSAWMYSTRCSTLLDVMWHGGKMWAFNGNDEILRLSESDMTVTDYTESPTQRLRLVLDRRFGGEPDGIAGMFHVNWVIEHRDGVCTEGLQWADEPSVLQGLDQGEAEAVHWRS